MFALTSLDIPILSAPMAGGTSTVCLTVAVSDAGGLGFLAGGYQRVEALSEQILAVQRRTHHAFGVNLFLPSQHVTDPAAVELYRDWLSRHGPTVTEDVAAELLGTNISDNGDDAFTEKVALVVRHRVPVVSFTFGLPPRGVVQRMQAVGSYVIATVTSLSEALAAVGQGVDALCVQGPDAGGHRATFGVADEPGVTTLGELVLMIRQVVSLPLIAAGGIHSGGQMASLLIAGVDGVQLGTAFLRTDESGTATAHQNALVDPRFTETVVTRAFSGRPARGLKNAFIARNEGAAPPEYPQVHHLTKGLRADAARRGDANGMALWAGTGHREAQTGPAAQVMHMLWAQAQAAVVS